MAPKSTSLFVRPRNMPISTLLQSLSITANLARRSNGKVVHTVAPREPYAQRSLSYIGVVVDDQDIAHSLSSQPHYFVGLTRRAAMSHPTLYYEQPVEERGAGLADVASIIGMRMGDRSYDYTKVDERSNDEELDASKEIVTSLDCQVERRQTTPRQRPGNRSVQLEARIHRRIASALNAFGGFSDRLRVKERS